ncbi:MAG: hypothetical protein IPO81_08420 [Kouleothrix sp.]|nr:hypothetical protein [Kouleothrix sp.]
MSSILLVPVHLDALLLTRDRPFVEARADFSRLPYTAETRDVNPDTPYIGEAIVSTPFQDQNLYLRAGIHLHWALPDALTRGVQSQQGTSFPPAPNRWLVTRSRRNAAGQPSIEGQWIVESDYLYPEGASNSAGSVNIPVTADPAKKKYQPFRYLGRKLRLAAWQPADPQAEYLDQLTAVGYGEPTFAAFYPNCHSVFGFHDPQYHDAGADGLQYDVVGWYSRGEQDRLATAVRDARAAYQQQHPGQTPDAAALAQAIQQALGWAVTLAPGQEYPEQMLCYARMTFDLAGAVNELPDVDARTAIAVGNTGTEALAAYLASAVDSGQKLTIEEQLEALLLAFRLENRHLDVGMKFQEARHENGFRAISSGSLWIIRPETAASTPADAADAQEQPTLPQPLADLLDAVNLQQQAYDQAQREIESLRRQLFADWYKYMLCAYPPEGDRESYPNADEVRHYVERKDIAPLRAAIAAAGALQLQQDASGNVTRAAAGDSAPTSLAATLARAINDLIGALDALNAQAAVASAPYALRPIEAPRFWQPNDPVVLLAGPAAEASHRHGQDGRLRVDGALECQTLPDATIQSLLPANLAKVRDQIDAIQRAATGETIAFGRWDRPAWNPFLLQWEVEFFPLQSRSNLRPETGHYLPDFITANYELAASAPDLTVRAGKGALLQAANIYSGSSILTPYAGVRLGGELAAFLREQLLADYCKARSLAVPADDQYEELLGARIADIRSWYEGAHKADLGAAAPQAGDPIYSAIRAYQLLRSLPVLSQALGGFNEALLMHRQTLQLDIADPLGFGDYQPFAQSVRDCVGRSNRSAAQPGYDFNPLRSGALKLLRLRLVDTFGQARDLDCGNVVTTEQMTVPASPYLVALPPRIAQPARLNFRWLSASAGAQEMNDHPATTPICGWILPNNLDDTLMIYDAAGRALGSISPLRGWLAAPGDMAPIDAAAIGNPHLRKVVAYLLADHGANFLEDFLAALDATLAAIDPESAGQHDGLALLIGRPIAVVRAFVNLELHGRPAVHHAWNAFRQDMRRNIRDTDDFTRVRFPIRIGEYRQLNDGLVGYWKETGDGYADDVFYAPQSDGITTPRIRSHADDPFNLLQSVEAPPQLLTLLVDPRGKVHATCGIAPTKSIDIPPDQYAAALQAIEATFFSAPILTDAGRVNLPLPSEPGYAWSWLQRERDGWTELSTTPTARKQQFLDTLGGLIWDRLLDRAVGWLAPTSGDGSTASVVAAGGRSSAALGAEFAGVEPAIGAILAAIGAPTIARAAFLDQAAAAIGAPAWEQLLDAAIGWLTVATAPDQAIVAAKDRRPSASLRGMLVGFERQVDAALDLSQVQIGPVSTRAAFAARQELREGWLKLRRSADAATAATE